MRHAPLLLAALASLTLACASPRVRTDFDPDVDFIRYERFAWLSPPLRDEPGEAESLGRPFVHNTLLDKRVRDSVEASLRARGFRKVESEPDFHLRYEIVTREVTQSTGPVYVGGTRRHGHYGTYAGYYGTYTYQEGTLIIDVIDPKSQRIAWRGWASTRTSSGGHVDEEKLNRYVAAILAEFPPKDGEPIPEG